jgi:hypothetical protein
MKSIHQIINSFRTFVTRTENHLGTANPPDLVKTLLLYFTYEDMCSIAKDCDVIGRRTSEQADKLEDLQVPDFCLGPAMMENLGLGHKDEYPCDCVRPRRH